MSVNYKQRYWRCEQLPDSLHCGCRWRETLPNREGRHKGHPHTPWREPHPRSHEQTATAGKFERPDRYASFRGLAYVTNEELHNISASLDRGTMQRCAQVVVAERAAGGGGVASGPPRLGRRGRRMERTTPSCLLMEDPKGRRYLLGMGAMC